jgi:hypothetical protein
MERQFEEIWLPRLREMWREDLTEETTRGKALAKFPKRPTEAGQLFESRACQRPNRHAG